MRRRVALLGAAGRRAQVDPTLAPFAESSPWRLGIATAATFAASGDARNTDMADIEAGGQAWVNFSDYSHPISYAANSDPLATMTDTVHGSGGIPDGGSWSERIPSTARIAAGSDAHMHIITPDRQYVQEHFATVRNSSTDYDCQRRHQVSLTGSGIGPQNGTRAYGGSAVGGLIRSWEVDPTHPRYTGAIRHALAVALRNDQLYHSGGMLGDDGFGPYTATGYGREQGYVWPASEQDVGSSDSGNYLGNIPMGSYFAIPPAAGLMMGVAAQNYGVYVTDRSGASVFYIEDAGTGTAAETFANDLMDDFNSAEEIKTLFRALRVVTSNGSSTPNGGALGASRRGT
jgi:hypothetical protein